MATVTVTIGASSKSWTVSAGDVTRIVNALKARYGPTMTNAEVFDLVANHFMSGLKSAVLDIEYEASAVTARATIPPIVAT